MNPSQPNHAAAPSTAPDVRTAGLPLLPTLEAPTHRAAVRVGDVTLSYAELAARARAHANALLVSGVSPGERVLVWATPSASTVVAIVGNALAGIVSVPVNPEISAAELSHVIKDAAPRVVVGDVAAARVTPVPVVPVGQGAASAGTLPQLGPDAPLMVLYTSGTTGAPKGVVHTHGSVSANLDAVFKAWEWSVEDELVHALPLFHGHGFELGLLGPLRRGAQVRILPRFEPAALAEALNEGGTLVFGAPVQFQRLAESCEREPLIAAAVRRARLLVTGSAPFPVRESNRLERATGHRVVERYGITETLINSSLPLRGERRAGHVGQPLEGFELRLVDDARVPLDVRDGRTIGEIAIRGPSLFKEYLNRPDATAAARDASGWFYTGDLGVLLPDGTLRLMGRRSTDLIRTAGQRVVAGEIESALLGHPAVREAAALGVPDDALGERVVGFVALHDDAAASTEEILAWAARSLEPHKHPATLHLIAALPRNAVGKVVKSALKATLR